MSDERGEASGGAVGAGPVPRGVDEPPPVLRTWRRLYWLVGGLLALDVVAMYLLARWAT